jgi:23S rRNA pseudouridine2605 synthase
MEPIRIQKFFTDCGVLSRRAAEEEIRAGHVRINGEIAQIGQKIDPEHDRVTYRGKPVTMDTHPRNVYVMLNKPRGYVTTMHDEQNRPCVTALMKDIPVRVYPIGRLDMDSEGLLLLTNDGELANKLTHPRHEIPKIYHVKIAGTVTQDQLKALGKPMNIDGYTIQPVEVKLISIQQDHCVLRMTLYEGRNRQIRKMCQTQMLSILTLRRIAIGNLELGNLAPGQWRYLTQSQVQYLKSNGANAKKR